MAGMAWGGLESAERMALGGSGAGSVCMDTRKASAAAADSVVVAVCGAGTVPTAGTDPGHASDPETDGRSDADGGGAGGGGSAEGEGSAMVRSGTAALVTTVCSENLPPPQHLKMPTPLPLWMLQAGASAQR